MHSRGVPGEGLLIESQGLVAVVLIDLVICGACLYNKSNIAESTESGGWLEASFAAQRP